MHKGTGWLAAVVALVTAMAAPATALAAQDMYRLYNPNSGEHFYTANVAERDSLRRVGWRYEQVGWVAPDHSATPVYRLYNPNAGDHHYTMNSNEKDMLVNAGWRFEGIGWYSDDAHSVTMFRQYNPNARSGSHNYTTNGSERDWLVSLGWRDEGLAWYALGPGRADPNADKPAPSNPGTGGGSASQGGGSTVTNVVYYTPNGGCYHKTASCRTLRRSKTILPASLTDAQQMGLKPCKECWH